MKEFLEKVWEWFKSTGVSNVFYIAIFIYAFIKGIDSLSFWSAVGGACLGIFLYINFNAIKKIVWK